MSAVDFHSVDMDDEDLNQTGKRFGYTNWLQPIISANDQNESTSDAQEHTPSPPPAPRRRGRGRPPVTKPRNESAIEKRRAQVRQAQRAYQKRKDTANATEKQRIDELLQLLSDLSGDVESLLQAGFTNGNMFRDDDVSKHIQRLWTTYDNVISNENVNPELRLLQVKNSRRLANHPSFGLNNGNNTMHQEPNPNAPVPPNNSEVTFDPNAIMMDMTRFSGTTVMKTYQPSAATDNYMAGRSIFQVVQDRQAAMKEQDRREANAHRG